MAGGFCAGSGFQGQGEGCKGTAEAKLQKPSTRYTSGTNCPAAAGRHLIVAQTQPWYIQGKSTMERSKSPTVVPSRVPTLPYPELKDLMRLQAWLVKARGTRAVLCLASLVFGSGTGSSVVRACGKPG